MSDWYEKLFAKTVGLEPLVTAVVHPVGQASIISAVEAAEANIIVPYFVGPKDRILAAAKKCNVDLSKYEIIDFKIMLMLPEKSKTKIAAKKDHKTQAQNNQLIFFLLCRKKHKYSNKHHNNRRFDLKTSKKSDANHHTVFGIIPDRPFRLSL